MAEMVMTAEKLNRKNSAKRFYRYIQGERILIRVGET